MRWGDSLRIVCTGSVPSKTVKRTTLQNLNLSLSEWLVFSTYHGFALQSIFWRTQFVWVINVYVLCVWDEYQNMASLDYHFANILFLLCVSYAGRQLKFFFFSPVRGDIEDASQAEGCCKTTTSSSQEFLSHSVCDSWFLYIFLIIRQFIFKSYST